MEEDEGCARRQCSETCPVTHEREGENKACTYTFYHQVLTSATFQYLKAKSLVTDAIDKGTGSHFESELSCNG
jgi:hypothetical protein